MYAWPKPDMHLGSMTRVSDAALTSTIVSTKRKPKNCLRSANSRLDTSVSKIHIQ